MDVDRRTNYNSDFLRFQQGLDVEVHTIYIEPNADRRSFQSVTGFIFDHAFPIILMFSSCFFSANAFIVL